MSWIRADMRRLLWLFGLAVLCVILGQLARADDWKCKAAEDEYSPTPVIEWEHPDEADVEAYAIQWGDHGTWKVLTVLPCIEHDDARGKVCARAAALSRYLPPGLPPDTRVAVRVAALNRWGRSEYVPQPYLVFCWPGVKVIG